MNGLWPFPAPHDILSSLHTVVHGSLNELFSDLAISDGRVVGLIDPGGRCASARLKWVSDLALWALSNSAVVRDHLEALAGKLIPVSVVVSANASVVLKWADDKVELIITTIDDDVSLTNRLDNGLPWSPAWEQNIDLVL